MYNAPILRRAHVWSWLVVLAGCGGGEEADLSFRYLFATNPDGLSEPAHPWEGYGCGTTAPEGAECVALRLAACSDATCRSVLDGESDTIVSLQSGTFDLPTKTATRRDLFLQAGVYSRDGVLLATGEAKDISFVDGKSVSVTMLPVGGTTACGDPAEGDGSAPLNLRAFHTATLLPNQQVLLVGGLSGPVVYTNNPTALEESIDVLDPRTGSHRRVMPVENQASGEEGSELFRAFHSAAYIGTEADGRYRIRIFGGIRAVGTGPSAIVSSTRADTPLQLLVAGDAAAQPAPPVDLLYDPDAGITVVDVAQDADRVPRASFGGFAVLTDEVGSDAEPGGTTGGYYVGGGIGEWRAAHLSVAEVEPVVGTFYTNQNGGTKNASPPALRVGRVGTTAIGIGPDQVLFWGGNAWSVEGADDPAVALADQIGELHRPDAAELPAFVAPDLDLPVVSTAFHAAAVASADPDGTRRIVVAGGYPITSIGTVAIDRLSPVPLYLLSFNPTNARAVVSAIDCQDRDGRSADCADVFGDVAFATATWFAPGQVLLVGGNFLYTHGALQTKYTARGVAGVVTVTGDSAVFRPIDLATARYGHTATRISGGAVLVYGGVTLDCSSIEDASGDCTTFGDLTPLSDYEIYNPGLAFAPEGACDGGAAE